MRFRTKMTLCMVWILSLVFGAGGSFLVGDSFAKGLSAQKTSALSSYQMLANTISVVAEAGVNGYDGIRDALSRISGGKSEWQALRVTANGDDLFSLGTKETGEVPEECTMEVRDEALRISGRIDAGQADIRVQAVYDLSALYAQRESQLKSYRRAFLVVVALGSGLSLLLCTVLTQPLRSLIRTSRELAGGNLKSRVRVRGDDELGQLSREFNEMADRLEGTVEHLQESMEKQEEFMGSFAHELKTPMTSILGYADLLRSQNLTAEERQEAANYIFSEGKRLESLSFKLMKLLTLDQDALTLRPVSPKALIEAQAREFRPILRRQMIALDCRCQKGDCLLEPDLFKSLLYNLMDNARKAMEDGGHILVEQTMTEDGCLVRVTDNGRGMPPEALGRITEAFYRVDKSRSRAQGGAGLGLSLCRKIVELHHGTMEFSSREGQGTCVTVALKGGVV